MSDHLRSARQSLLFELAGLLLFVALVWLLADAAQPLLKGVGLIVAGVVLAVVPAAIWLSAFYRQDRLEPEPKLMILGIFLLGVLLAQAVGEPLIRNVFEAPDWLGTNLVSTVFGLILVVGIIQEFIKYAVVRYVIFPMHEFDQRIDGIIYGASVGLGYATAINLAYVVSSGGVDLGVGVLRIAVAALAHASFGGVTGYFLGRAKFDDMGPFWLPAGLLTAATLNGVVTYALREVPFVGSFSFNPWYGFAIALVVAGATFTFLLVTLRRLNAAEPVAR